MNVSVVVPARDEAKNLPVLIDEVARALAPGGGFEVIVVNDGSLDDTEAVLARLASDRPWLRQIRHAERCGQSAAIATGVAAARAALVVTLDGDGQNDPAYIQPLIAALNSGGARLGLVAGQRTGRSDGFMKAIASQIANGVRAGILGDRTRDTGCGLKAFRRDVFLRLPYFDNMHRYYPALVLREGYEIAHIDVIDRARRHGRSNYGIIDRLLVGILDLAGVWWLRRRRASVPFPKEILPSDSR